MATGQLNLGRVKLGDSANPANNFIISTPAVPGGSLTIERENGTNVLSIDANGKVTLTAADNQLPLGVEQTWYDVTANRAVGTTYYNTAAGRPIMVSVRSSVDDGYSQLTVGGVVLAISGSTLGTGSNQNTVCAIVPDGATYSYSGSAIALWAELR